MGPYSKHIIDYLMFQAKKIVEAALTDLHRSLESSDATTTDPDIMAYWDRFEADFGDLDTNGKPRSPWFLALRDGLRSDVEACMTKWSGMTGTGARDYRDMVQYVYAMWQDIKPRFLADERNETVNIAEKFLLEAGSRVLDLSRWELVKASWSFKHYHRSRFVWQMAGRQLQTIKALAANSGGPFSTPNAPVLVASNMYAALKPDNTYIKRLVALDGDEDATPGATPDAEPVWGLEVLSSEHSQ